MAEAGGDPRAPSPRRVVVAVDARRNSLAALWSAAELASILHATLVGVYVYDVVLAKLGEHPAVREVMLTSGAIRRPTRSEVEREFAVQSARARRATSAAAEAAGLSWTFEQATGYVADELVTLAGTSYLITVARTRGPFDGRRRIGSNARAVLAASGRPVLVVGPGNRWRGPVAVVYDGSPSADAAVRLALESLPAERRALVLVLPRAGTAVALEVLRDAARRIASTAQMPVQVIEVAALHSVLVLDAVMRARAGALILHTRLQFADASGLDRVIAELNIPVAVMPSADPTVPPRPMDIRPPATRR